MIIWMILVIFTILMIWCFDHFDTFDTDLNDFGDFDVFDNGNGDVGVFDDDCDDFEDRFRWFLVMLGSWKRTCHHELEYDSPFFENLVDNINTDQAWLALLPRWPYLLYHVIYPFFYYLIKNKK